MPRYAIFAGQLYYPEDGWDDFKFLSDNKKEIRSIYNKSKFEKFDKYNELGMYDWIHIVNLDTGKIIKRWEL